MDDAVDLLGLKQDVQRFPVADVQLVKTRLGVDCRAEAGEQVVGNHYVPPGVNQFIYRVRADITRAAQY